MTNTPSVLIPGSIGELFDKLSILEIKKERIQDIHKLGYIVRELDLLNEIALTVLGPVPKPTELVTDLKRINEALWDIEDAIRGYEQRNDFGADFITLARAVYLNNDRRADLKRELNALFGSEIVEQKSYTAGSYHRPLLTGVSPFAHADGGDGVGAVDEPLTGIACDIVDLSRKRDLKDGLA